VLLLVAVFLALLAAHPESILVVLAYGYLVLPFVEMAWHRMRRRRSQEEQVDDSTTDEPKDSVTRL
jgi:Flp pilus assembly protein TadB